MARYKNDETGAPAYDPAILLKVILFAYSRGVTASREIERLCRENVVFMALSADSQPHFTTIADFIATLEFRLSGTTFASVRRWTISLIRVLSRASTSLENSSLSASSESPIKNSVTNRSSIKSPLLPFNVNRQIWKLETT